MVRAVDVDAIVHCHQKLTGFESGVKRRGLALDRNHKRETLARSLLQKTEGFPGCNYGRHSSSTVELKPGF
jgi:hypothetical protein